MPGENYTTLAPLEFLHHFQEHIQTATKRIWLQSMNLDPGEFVDETVAALIQKVKSGIEVRVTVDWISEQYYQSRFDYLPNPNLKWQLEKRAFRQRRKVLLDQLSQAGAIVTYTNIPNYLMSWMPQVGRNHTKIYLVDDTVWIGGVNFMPSSFHTYDAMIESQQPKLVQALELHFHEVNEKRPLTNYSVEISPQTKILFDNGQRNHSLIYDEAIASTLSATQEILFISQIVPSGRFLEALLTKAKQGIPVTFVTSSHADELYSSFFPRLLYQQFLSKIKPVANFKLYHVDKKVHLKLLVVDKQELFFGSHNLSQLGVQFGTEELMLQSKNAALLTSFQSLLSSFQILPNTVR